jgi:ubiquitin-protein ligase
MKATIKRIINKDFKTIEDLKKNNIYLEFDEANILKAKALIIGPEDTIYFGGLYFFDIEFPNNYPHIPPIITYKSSSPVRIHPNLYVGGKVCLSVLGTWKGPPWTSSMDISCILLSIQSLLNNSPLINEPGFENYNGSLSIDYSKMVEYENIKFHFYNHTKKIPENFLMFQNIVNKNYINNKNKILLKIDNLKKKDNYPITVNIYRIKVIVNYKKIYEYIEKFKL